MQEKKKLDFVFGNLRKLNIKYVKFILGSQLNNGL